MAEERGESGTDEGVPGPMFDAIKSGSRVNRLLSLFSPYFFAVSHCEKIVCALHSCLKHPLLKVDFHVDFGVDVKLRSWKI